MSDIEAIRKKFEQWYVGNQDVALSRSGDGYKYASVQAAWTAFKAGFLARDAA